MQYSESIEYWERRNEFKKHKHLYNHYLRNLNTVVCLLFSHNGVLKISLQKHIPKDSFFKEGIWKNFSINILPYAGRKRINTHWKNHYTKTECSFDFMVLVADNNEDRLSETSLSIRQYFEDLEVARQLFKEDGAMLFNESGKAIEPFGFRDGLSKISFFSEKTGKLKMSRKKIVLDDDQGSFMVFLKLQQHVDKFEKKVDYILEKLFPGEKDPDTIRDKRAFVEAQFMGRFKDGTPLALSPEPTLGKKGLTEVSKEEILKFNLYTASEDGWGYEKDPLGKKCPFHAHARKMNVRESAIINQDGKGPYENDGEKRIPLRVARRGIPYKNKTSDEAEAGLLFMSYQARIQDHFPIIIKDWANEKEFPENDRHPRPGVDPIIGRDPNERLYYTHYWNKAWDSDAYEEITTDFKDLITLRGGEYLYAPSLLRLKQLKEDAPPA
jgi:Dyp-type peroxidase family